MNVAIPLGQGQVFNELVINLTQHEPTSQSLWVRDRFLIAIMRHIQQGQCVAIPLGQGQVFNL